MCSIIRLTHLTVTDCLFCDQASDTTCFIIHTKQEEWEPHPSWKSYNSLRLYFDWFNQDISLPKKIEILNVLCLRLSITINKQLGWMVWTRSTTGNEEEVKAIQVTWLASLGWAKGSRSFRSNHNVNSLFLSSYTHTYILKNTYFLKNENK